MINICSVKNVIVFPQKYCWGGGHVCASKERAHPHGENGPHVERENRPDRKKCTHKGKSHPHEFFYSSPPRASAYSCSLLSPGERLLLPPPLGAPIMTAPPPPIHFILFLENFKKSAKITEKTFFWLFHFTITYQILIFSFVNINVLINSHLIQ